MKKRFLALLLTMSFVFTTAASVNAKEVELNKVDLGTSYDVEDVKKAKAELEEGKEVTAIITLKEKNKPNFSILKTEEGKKARIAETKKLRDEFKNSLKSLKLEYDVVFEYDFLFAGFAIKTSNKNLKEIEKLQEVDTVEISVEYAKPQFTKKIGKLQNSTAINGGRAFRSIDSNDLIKLTSELQKNHNGQGRVVAVLDSGIDVNHPILNVTEPAKGMYPNKDSMNKKMAEVGIDYGSWRNEKVVYAHNYYSNGENVKEDQEASHGMHVSGTAVGNPKVGEKFVVNGKIKEELITGVAPEAQLIFMNVFNGQGRTFTHAYAKAVEDSVKLGADSVNLSLGSPNGTEINVGKAMNKAIEYARSMGSIVAIAAGNDGHFGYGQYKPNAANPDYGTLGSPGVAKDALTVAAMNTTVERTEVVNFNGESLKVGKVTLGEGQTKGFLEKNEDSKEFDFVFVNLGGEDADYNGKDVSNKIAVIERGKYTFATKIAKAHEKGAVGVVIINHEAGGDSIFEMIYGNEANIVKIPAVFMGHTNGKKLKEAKEGKITFNSKLSVLPFAKGGTLTDFSSYGYSTDGEFKPDITAPGGLIYSSINNNKYMSMDGTSMATPHVAGAVPIVRKALIDKNAGFTGEQEYDVIKALMMSTADPVVDFGTTNYVSPRKQGAGALNVAKAISSNIYVVDSKENMAKVSLRDLDSSKFDFKVKLINFGKTEYNLEFTTVLGTDLVENGVFQLKTRTLDTIKGSKVTVPANSTKEVTISVDATRFEEELKGLMPNGFFLEGFVFFRDANDNSEVISIPFSGFRGKWAQIPVWEKPIYEFDLKNAKSNDKPMYAGNLVESINANMTSLVTLEKSDFVLPKKWNATGEFDANGPFNLHGDYNVIPAGFDWDTKTFMKDKIAFSPNADGNRDSIIFRGVFYRNAQYISADVFKDGEKEPVFKSGSAYFAKNSNTNREGAPKSNIVIPTEWLGKDNKGAKLPDGKYKYVVKASSTVLGAEDQKLEFDVMLDTVAPVIKKPVVNGEIYKPEITDELSGVDSVLVMGYYKGKFYPRLKQADGTINIPSVIDQSKSYVVAFDRAGNMTKLMLDGQPVAEAPAVQYTTGARPVLKVTDYKDKDGNLIVGSENINMFMREKLERLVTIYKELVPGLFLPEDLNDIPFVDGKYILKEGKYKMTLTQVPPFYNYPTVSEKEFEVVDGQFTDVIFETTVKENQIEQGFGQAGINVTIDGNSNIGYLNFISYVIKDEKGNILNIDDLTKSERVLVKPIKNAQGQNQDIDFIRIPYLNIKPGSYTLEITSNDSDLKLKIKKIPFTIEEGKLTVVEILGNELSKDVFKVNFEGVDELPEDMKVVLVDKETSEEINIRKSKFNPKSFSDFAKTGKYIVKITVPYNYRIDRNEFEIVLNGSKIQEVVNIKKIDYDKIFEGIKSDKKDEQPKVEEPKVKEEPTKVVYANPNSKWEKQDDRSWKFKDNGEVVKDAWIKDGKHWFKVEKDGTLAENKIVEVDGNKFYAKKGGYIAENQWVSVDGKWHYANNGGYLAKNQWVKNNNNWYWLDENNTMVANKWIAYKGKWYYANSTGKLVTSGWKKINGKWYHFKADGELSVSTKVGKYYVDANGEWIK